MRSESIAICFTGEVRTFRWCADSILGLIRRLQKSRYVKLYFFISFNNTVAGWKRNDPKWEYEVCIERMRGNQIDRTEFTKIIDGWNVPYELVVRDSDSESNPFLRILRDRQYLLQQIPIDQFDQFFFTRPDIRYQNLDAAERYFERNRYFWDVVLLINREALEIFRRITPEQRTEAIDSYKDQMSRLDLNHMYYIQILERAGYPIEADNSIKSHVLFWNRIPKAGPGLKAGPKRIRVIRF